VAGWRGHCAQAVACLAEQTIDALQDFAQVIQSQGRLGRRKGDKGRLRRARGGLEVVALSLDHGGAGIVHRMSL
jgi:hypothetical protein